MANKQISYIAKDFNSIRAELLNYVKQYYPDLMQDFSDASIGVMLLELNAAVGDMLSFNLDRQYQETLLDYAQERKNILAIARTLGLNIPGKSASITIADFSVIVPPFGDTFDNNYLPILKAGTQAIGNGKVFELVEDVDFSNPFGRGGVPNRLVIPNFDANDIIQSYTITKRELVNNGATKYLSKTVTQEDFKPFMQLILPDQDVISVEQVIALDGTNFSTIPSIDEFFNDKLRYFEVEHLAESQIFVPDFTRVSDKAGVVPGKYLDVTKKFIKEFTDKGFCKLTFGSGIDNGQLFNDYLTQLSLSQPLGDFINNSALGEIPKIGSTIFVRYRVGGGTQSNIGANVLTQLGNVNIFVNGPREDINRQVRASLRVNNPIPAIGGKDQPSVEEIRKLATYNFGSQNRCVTIRDYLTQIKKMPGKFGNPFRVTAYEYQNKIIIPILTLDENGKLDNKSTSTLKENISDYLSQYRMINDFVEIKDGKVIDLAIDVDVYTDKQFSQTEIASTIISRVTDYFNINNHEMNENIYLGNLIEAINNVSGVLNVIEIRIYNKVGGQYSLNETSMEYLDINTRQINPVDYTLFGEIDGQFQCRFPQKDIKVRIKN